MALMQCKRVETLTSCMQRIQLTNALSVLDLSDAAVAIIIRQMCRGRLDLKVNNDKLRAIVEASKLAVKEKLVA